MNLRNSLRTAVGGAVLLSLIACAGNGTGRSSDAGGADVITRSQIANGQFATAYEVVQRLRPRWLRPPTAARSFRDVSVSAGPARTVTEGASRVQVYFNNTHLGGLESLSNIEAEAVEQIEFVDRSDAAIRFGTNNDQGAIVMTPRVD